MAWNPSGLDHLAHAIVRQARHRDSESLNQAYKMRAACAYGLERFWGEHLRLAGKKIEKDKAEAIDDTRKLKEIEKDNAKAQFVADTWKAFVGILHKARPYLKLPGTMLSRQSEAEIQAAAHHIWLLDPQEHQISLTVLTALCDSIVWWTQRLKLPKAGDR